MLETIKMSDEFGKDILSGLGKFVKDGYVHFNRIRLRGSNGRMEIDFYKDGIFLFTSGEKWACQVYIPAGYEYNLSIDDGTMRISFPIETIVQSVANFDEWNW